MSYGSIGDSIVHMFFLLVGVIAALILALIWSLTSWKVALTCAVVGGLIALGVWIRSALE